MKGMIKPVGIIVLAMAVVFAVIVSSRSDAQAVNADRSSYEYAVYSLSNDKCSDKSVKFDSKLNDFDQLASICNSMSSHGYELDHILDKMLIFKRKK